MTTRAKWILGIFLAIILAPIGWVLWPPVYWADGIHARVVDAATGQPLAGVNVVAHWELNGPLENVPVGQLQVLETVTNENGEFAFPAWGPRLRWPLYGFLRWDDPELVLFKRDYEWERLSNERFVYNTGPRRRSEWNGNTIRLKPYERNTETYAEDIRDFEDRRLDFAFFHRDCSWKHIPQMLVALQREKQRLNDMGLRDSSGHPLVLEEQDKNRSPAEIAICGSVQEFLRSYLP